MDWRVKLFRTTSLAGLILGLGGALAKGATDAHLGAGATESVTGKTVDFIQRAFRPMPRIPTWIQERDVLQDRSMLRDGAIRTLEDHGAFLHPRLVDRLAESDATVELPKSATQAFAVSDGRSGARVEVRLVGLRPVRPNLQHGIAVYRGAVRDGAWLHRVTKAGTEDYLLLAHPVPRNRLQYAVHLGSGIAGLRLVADTLEFIDPSGSPVLRVSPPWLSDSRGVTRNAVTVQIWTPFTAGARPPMLARDGTTCEQELAGNRGGGREIAGTTDGGGEAARRDAGGAEVPPVQVTSGRWRPGRRQSVAGAYG